MNGKLDRPEQDLSADIPVAQRDGVCSQPPRPARTFPWQWLAIVAVALGAIGGGIAIWRVIPWAEILATREDTETPQAAVADEPAALAPADGESGDNSQQITEADLLGHRPYTVASADTLRAVTADGRVRLRGKAAEQFLAMQADARARGISLAALSGYRTFEEQKYLFFQIKADRAQDARDRAKVSAPPGYSEHHTGYAIDIGDGSAPSTHIQESFENTPAFAWLERNAARYDFELSFPRDNEQGISYEPWHWRYVGDLESLETFYKGDAR